MSFSLIPIESSKMEWIDFKKLQSLAPKISESLFLTF